MDVASGLLGSEPGWGGGLSELAGVALQRHGPRTLMRAPSRTHRDPEDISAF